jgi:hypothetical protein
MKSMAVGHGDMAEESCDNGCEHLFFLFSFSPLKILLFFSNKDEVIASSYMAR